MTSRTIPVRFADASLRTGRRLLVAWLAVVGWSALAPRDAAVWAAETVLPVFFVGWLAVTARSFPLSRLSYAMVFVFLVLHQVGAHHTYPLVPFAELGSRNHYDRVVHAAFGLLLTQPLREVVVRMIGARGFWREALPVSLVTTASLLYEFIEWFIAVRWDGGGESVLGAQGDPWDSHWDLLLAAAGSIFAAAAGALARWTTRRARSASLRSTHRP